MQVIYYISLFMTTIHTYCMIVTLTVTLAASSVKRNATAWRSFVCLSLCPVSTLTVTHQGAACDAASVYFGPTT